MASVGIDLQHWVDAGLLQFRCVRPSLLGLEAHLFAMQKLVAEFEPAVVVMDPISDLLQLGAGEEVSAMLTRQVDFLKSTRRDRAVHQPQRDTRRASSADQQIGVARRHLAAGQDRWRATASTTACSTCSSRAAWPTPTRSASSCSPTEGIELADVYRPAAGAS